MARIWPRYSLRGLHIRIIWFSLYGIRITLFSLYGIHMPLLPYMVIQPIVLGMALLWVVMDSSLSQGPLLWSHNDMTVIVSRNTRGRERDTWLIEGLNFALKTHLPSKYAIRPTNLASWMLQESKLFIFVRLFTGFNCSKEDRSGACSLYNSVLHWPVNSLTNDRTQIIIVAHYRSLEVSHHKRPVMEKVFSCDDVFMAFHPWRHPSKCGARMSRTYDHPAARLSWSSSQQHYGDVIMTTIASQITSLTIVYRTFIRAQIKVNIKAPRHWPLCVEFTGDRWIPRTKGQ